MLGAAVAVLVAASLAVAPSRAGAFVGEELVIDRVAGDLTGPAKTILEKPTFLPSTVEAAGGLGTAEATGAASVFQGAGILPALGSVVAFGVGTVIGSEICDVIGIEGCWYHGSEGADPSVSGGAWVFQNGPIHLADPLGTPNPSYSWWWQRDGSSLNASTSSVYEDFAESACGVAGTPAGQSGYHIMQVAADGCGSGRQAAWGGWFRLGMENRVLEYHATDDPGIDNYSHTAPADWTRRLAAQLEGEDGTAAARVGQKIASDIEGSEVLDPYATYVEIPDCDGLIWSECEDALERVDLVPDRLSEDWRTAVIEKPAGAVLELDPIAGSELEVGRTVIVTTNPDEADMPLLVPQPLEGETYADYIARLAPGLDPRRTIVAAEFTDPSTGPNGVIRTEPGAGSRADPATSTEVEVFTNSPEAPPAAGSWTAPAIPAVDLSPLAGIAIGCNDFPFGIFCWIGDGLTNWGASGRCPEVDVPFGASARIDTELPFDLCQFEPAMEIIRPILILVAAFTLAYFFAAAAMGFGGGSNED